MDKEQKSRGTEELLEKLLAIYREREWEPFHSPKNLVMALSAEVGELVEPFRWLTEEQSYQLDERTRAAVADEIGDVYQLLLYLSHKLGIDPHRATFEKIDKIAEKYPVALYRGRATHVPPLSSDSHR